MNEFEQTLLDNVKAIRASMAKSSGDMAGMLTEMTVIRRDLGQVTQAVMAQREQISALEARIGRIEDKLEKGS
ncbi:MAG: hypothetical protein AAGC57_08940 [Pseudomonadota bacterium]